MSSSDSSLIGIDEIKQWLPHRKPMLLIDTATDFISGKSLVGHLCPCLDDGWFNGHFPGNPIMPGVLLVECMAQVGALLAAKTWNISPKTHTIMFTSIDKTKFRNTIIPGDELDIPVQILVRKRNFIQFSGKVIANGKMAVSCIFWASSVENK
ncbi:3-hydroxyacyl-ACP dehydratase FabZ [Oceanicaulis sp. AH-315-P02]|nr:3-hydroxyacyl-ACP dehydratase FabZ [Robiginitomaculum sp.]MBN4047748.1 3-hydroxyacyl-ACP dehydratase FabZ [Oceanicaulis sp. AH-315-P02]